ncbi:MAG TPA: hypothetical protein VF221_22815 [Chloroflexota bacterium]
MSIARNTTKPPPNSPAVLPRTGFGGTYLQSHEGLPVWHLTAAQSATPKPGGAGWELRLPVVFLILLLAGMAALLRQRLIEREAVRVTRT